MKYLGIILAIFVCFPVLIPLAAWKWSRGGNK